MTYTVLARDRRTGLIGGATASRSLAVGNAVLMLRPGVGVVASQAWTNRSLRALLLDAVAHGATAEDALRRIPAWDDGAGLRQAALLPETGAPAAYSGSGITAWAGDLVASDAVYAGNLLAGRSVLSAMRDALDDAPPIGSADPASAARFAQALVRALSAGEAHGGDARGRQSAAVVVATTGAGADVEVDLRVDDHGAPLVELARLVELRAEALSVRTE